MLPDCDCLNDCGDDPALQTGNAKPCQQWHRDRAVEAEKARVIAMADSHYKKALSNGTVCMPTKDIDDLRRLIKGLPTSGHPMLVPNSNSTTPD